MYIMRWLFPLLVLWHLLMAKRKADSIPFLTHVSPSISFWRVSSNVFILSILFTFALFLFDPAINVNGICRGGSGSVNVTGWTFLNDNLQEPLIPPKTLWIKALHLKLAKLKCNFVFLSVYILTLVAPKTLWIKTLHLKLAKLKCNLVFLSVYILTIIWELCGRGY